MTDNYVTVESNDIVVYSIEDGDADWTRRVIHWLHELPTHFFASRDFDALHRLDALPAATQTLAADIANVIQTNRDPYLQ